MLRGWYLWRGRGGHNTYPLCSRCPGKALAVWLITRAGPHAGIKGPHCMYSCQLLHMQLAQPKVTQAQLRQESACFWVAQNYSLYLSFHNNRPWPTWQVRALRCKSLMQPCALARHNQPLLTRPTCSSNPQELVAILVHRFRTPCHPHLPLQPSLPPFVCLPTVFQPSSLPLHTTDTGTILMPPCCGAADPGMWYVAV